MAQEAVKDAAKDQLQEQEQKDQKAIKQRSLLRTRIRAIATSAIKGNFDKVEQPYRPLKVQDAEHAEWQTLSKNQDNLMKRIAAANDAMDGGLSKQALIVSLRGDFPDIAKKIPEPVKKAAPVAEAPPPPVAPIPAPQQTNQQAAEKKRKQIELDDDDDDDEEYDPDAEGRAQREERTAKRQRTTGQDTLVATATVTELKPMMDEEELEMQIQEIKMKADLAILQLRRKFAADKKKREQIEARIKREVV